MGERKCIDLTGMPISREGPYATNNQYQKAGPKGFIQVKVLENDDLYIRVDLPGVPDDAIRYRVDAVRQKVVIFSGETIGNPVDPAREYSGTAGLACDCCEISGVDAKMKDGVLRMILSRVKVKDQHNKCTLTVPPLTVRSGRHLEDHPYVVKGRKRAHVMLPTPDGGLCFAVDVPGVCPDDIEVLVGETEVRFRAEVKDVYEHDESGRVYLGSVNSKCYDGPSPSIKDHNIGWDAAFGVLNILIRPPPGNSTSTSTTTTNNNNGD